MPWLVAGLIVLAAAAVAVDRLAFSEETQASRPDLQRLLDGLVAGPNGVAPGATAYVYGPNGTWVGSAGVANVQTREPMRADARMRLESNSKTWAMAVILQLAREGKLRVTDTVERWLPGLLPYGDRITIHQLMSDTSGLTDDNDLVRSRAAFATMVGRIEDAKLRAQVMQAAARQSANPAAEISPMLLIRIASWQPLLFQPGNRYHHSNTGWDIVGLIGARAGGKPLPQLYRERLFEPLGLKQTAYDPQGPIDGPHATGYNIGPGGGSTDATARHAGKGADGALVSSAEDEATFLKAMMGGRLGIRQQVLAFFGTAGDTGCQGSAYSGEGAGAAYRTYTYYDQTGSRVAVLMLNGFRDSSAAAGEPRAAAAARRLFCSA